MSQNFFLQGEKISFRPYQEADAELIARWQNDPVTTYFMFTGQKPTTLEQVKAALASDVCCSSKVIFTVVENKKGQPIGLVGLYEINAIARKAEMRVMIGNQENRGKGFGTEICELINFYGFDRLNLNRIWLGFTGANPAAQRAYEKAGYQQEGVLRQDIYRNSGYYDTVRMAILREDYYMNFYPVAKEKYSFK